MLEGIMEEAKVTMTAYKKRVECFFNQKVHPRLFKVRDLVLKHKDHYLRRRKVRTIVGRPLRSHHQ